MVDFVFAELLIFIGALVFLGAVAGFLAGLLGVGGGIILVPGLYMIFEYLHPRFGFDMAQVMHVCVGTSLAVIIPTGYSSMSAHRKKGAVDFDLVRGIGVGVGIGAFIVSLLAQKIDGAIMQMVFASALMLMAFIMMSNPSRFQIKDQLPKQPIPNIAGFVIGSLSGLIGIGGATLSVPYMTLHGVHMHKAVGSATALGLIIAVPAAFGYVVTGLDAQNLPPYSLGYVNYLAWACIIPASVLCAPYGASVAHQVSVTKLKIYFAFFMIFVALNMWRKIIFGS